MKGEHVFCNTVFEKDPKLKILELFFSVRSHSCSALVFMLWSTFINDQKEIIKSLLMKFVNGLKIERVVNNKEDILLYKVIWITWQAEHNQTISGSI